ncbi:MAG: FAD-binding protein [Methanomassiliicoccales archaeon]|nr:FAD-binding protein [Methanomassiliicoccales archaeon]
MRRALVIGLGAAGLMAGYMLARRGWKVTALGRGTPASAMSTGCLRSLPPERGWLEELKALFLSAGLPMSEGPRTGVTNLGTRFDCRLSPSISTWEEGSGPRSIAVLGVRGHPSLRPALAASMISSWGPRARTVPLDLEVPAEASLCPLFRDDAHLDLLVEGIQATSEDAVLLPALFSLPGIGRWKELERRSGRRLLEAVTPLGVPGQRFVEVLEQGAKRTGVEMWPGRRAVSLELDGAKVTAAEVQGGTERRTMEVDTLLLATGGALVDGVLWKGQHLEDPLSTFVMVQDGAEGGGYDHVDERLLIEGERIINAFGAGDCLAYSQGRYGDGLAHAIASAWRAVRAMEGL